MNTQVCVWFFEQISDVIPRIRLVLLIYVVGNILFIVYMSDNHTNSIQIRPIALHLLLPPPLLIRTNTCYIYIRIATYLEGSA